MGGNEYGKSSNFGSFISVKFNFYVQEVSIPMFFQGLIFCTRTMQLYSLSGNII